MRQFTEALQFVVAVPITLIACVIIGVYVLLLMPQQDPHELKPDR